MKIAAYQKQNEEQFSCPSCLATSRFSRFNLLIDTKDIDTQCMLLVCAACNAKSLWKVNARYPGGGAEIRILDPIASSAPPPTPDMPEEVKKDYEEASLVSIYSAKAACALLRLALQKLCRHLGEPGKNINTDIRSLAQRDGFPASIVTAADALRITGNNAVHPGRMSDDDIEEVSKGLFGLLNYIVEQGITKPRELEAIFDKVPTGAVKAEGRKSAPVESEEAE